jgi:hypothetical protein
MTVLDTGSFERKRACARSGRPELVTAVLQFQL